MADHNEIQFETELCEYLAAHGWLYSPNDTGYDKTRALFPEDVFGWLADTQPDELAKVVTLGGPQEAKQKSAVLAELVRCLDTPLDNSGGTLAVLRKGFKHVSARFNMCEFKPETSKNAATLKRYDKVRLRVVRQVHFSPKDGRSIDLVFFVNGLPVATTELKTDFTQSVQEAIQQYKNDRDPSGSHAGGKSGTQPLLQFGSRALVHFAVSNDEVWMTTRLNGAKTRFLPFNQGYEGGKGNPPAADGKSSSAYLWEQILQRETWLNIIGKFLHVQTIVKIDPINGKRSKVTTLLFPRYHQWEVVTSIVEAARNEGPGHKYLVENSAGSGKTNSISWLGHRLASLHDANDKPVFDGVIIVTDRNVLDEQLQAALQQIDGGKGVVASIGKDEVRKSGKGSKSNLLTHALTSGKRIIVVTINTFPYAMEKLGSKALEGKNFAVIADEAHSSQTGKTANQLRDVLTSAEIEAMEDGAGVDMEALLAEAASKRSKAVNVSFFAFTATPKAKTLELFGRPNPDDPEAPPEPFHRYTMKQAIEEGYILNVLRGYTTYKTAFEIAQKVKEGDLGAVEDTAGAEGGDGREVDQAAATKGLMKWVRLHPTNIASKVEVIVEHYRENVQPLLGGHAKAMVVTDSRKAAVRYKIEIDAYIKKMGYEMGTLVAFSDKVTDKESGPEDFTESNMNPGLRGRKIPAAFATEEFRILLVANKFQTGFDQPLLCGMYVDKRLPDISAVQTLSRLNRMYTAPDGEEKVATFVLDFVNEPGDIQTSFEKYYVGATLETETDPNLVHRLAAKLDGAGIYDDGIVDAVAKAHLGRKGNSALTSAIAPAKNAFKTRYQAAQNANDGKGDKAALDELDLFRKDVGTFVRLYDFMSQIVDYGDPDLEKRAIFLRLLERVIRPENYSAEIDLSDVALKRIRQIKEATEDIKLGGEVPGLKGITAAGSGAKKDPVMIALAEVIARLNDMFGADAFSEEQGGSVAMGVAHGMAEDPRIVEQVMANSAEQFLESPHLRDGIVVAASGQSDATNKITEALFGEGPEAEALKTALGSLAWSVIRGKDGSVD